MALGVTRAVLCKDDAKSKTRTKQKAKDEKDKNLFCRSVVHISSFFRILDSSSETSYLPAFWIRHSSFHS